MDAATWSNRLLIFFSLWLRVTAARVYSSICLRSVKMRRCWKAACNILPILQVVSHLKGPSEAAAGHAAHLERLSTKELPLLVQAYLLDQNFSTPTCMNAEPTQDQVQVCKQWQAKLSPQLCKSAAITDPHQLAYFLANRGHRVRMSVPAPRGTQAAPVGLQHLAVVAQLVVELHHLLQRLEAPGRHTERSRQHAVASGTCTAPPGLKAAHTSHNKRCAKRKKKTGLHNACRPLP